MQKIAGLLGVVEFNAAHAFPKFHALHVSSACLSVLEYTFSQILAAFRLSDAPADSGDLRDILENAAIQKPAISSAAAPNAVERAEMAQGLALNMFEPRSPTSSTALQPFEPSIIQPQGSLAAQTAQVTH